MKKQNLYLFYEPADDDDRKIDSKLVRLYMNRFIIEEDDQNEILGVAYLTRIKKSYYPHRLNYETVSIEVHPEDSDIFYRWKESRTIKLMQDTRVINACLTKSKQFEKLNGDFHFIIGSSFYMSLYRRHWFPEKSPEVKFDLEEFHKPRPIEELVVSIIDNLSTLHLNTSLVFTFICGLNFALCKNSEFQQAYKTNIEGGYKPLGRILGPQHHEKIF